MSCICRHAGQRLTQTRSYVHKDFILHYLISSPLFIFTEHTVIPSPPRWFITDINVCLISHFLSSFVQKLLCLLSPSSSLHPSLLCFGSVALIEDTLQQANDRLGWGILITAMIDLRIPLIIGSLISPGLPYQWSRHWRTGLEMDDFVRVRG